jgi:hypothetical protein
MHDSAGNLWQPDLCEVSPDILNHIIKAQGTFDRHAARASFDALLASLDTGSEAGKHDLAPLPQLRVPPSLGLDGNAPTLARCGAQEQGGPDGPPPPA